jgi:hypothetical protein
MTSLLLHIHIRAPFIGRTKQDSRSQSSDVAAGRTDTLQAVQGSTRDKELAADYQTESGAVAE